MLETFTVLIVTTALSATGRAIYLINQECKHLDQKIAEIDQGSRDIPSLDEIMQQYKSQPMTGMTKPAENPEPALKSA
jgi:hypothetical protein